MKPFISKAGVVAFLLCAAFAGNAFAWGQDGHRAVCRIAYLLLDEAQQKEVTRLTAAYRDIIRRIVPGQHHDKVFRENARDLFNFA